MNSISIDYGTHKSGLAYCVEGFAFAYKTIKTSEILKELSVFILSRNADTLIIGMPYNIDGTMSKHGRRVQSFANICKKQFPSLSVIFHDERLTTSEACMSGAEDIDAESARLILESYMESLRILGSKKT